MRAFWSGFTYGMAAPLLWSIGGVLLIARLVCLSVVLAATLAERGGLWCSRQIAHIAALTRRPA